ncbi:hypothetical protein OHA69_40650 [Streptomyces anulatus]|uniref:hypothetical protein n=1 Tax=Streptomyces anulatus TaxID=1892 RepID=UPI0022525739|nr:hypothetical protein [Streptomyces anulatus]MCX4523900.1 hypothetical protein [Streptomyces anulatus]
MRLSIVSPSLFVLRVSVTDGSGTERCSWAMPSAPYGSPAWQLPSVVAHLVRLERTQEPPSVSGFAEHLRSWSSSSVPPPQTPHPFDVLHDPRVSCWVDAHLEPAHGSERWPRVTLAVLQQESGRCAWSRITRHRGAYSVIAHTYTEAAAEVSRLADRARSVPDAGTAAALCTAQQIRDWTWGVHRKARAEQVLVRAGQQFSATSGPGDGSFEVRTNTPIA